MLLVLLFAFSSFVYAVNDVGIADIIAMQEEAVILPEDEVATLIGQFISGDLYLGDFEVFIVSDIDEASFDMLMNIGYNFINTWQENSSFTIQTGVTAVYSLMIHVWVNFSTQTIILNWDSSSWVTLNAPIWIGYSWSWSIAWTNFSTRQAAIDITVVYWFVPGGSGNPAGIRTESFIRRIFSVYFENQKNSARLMFLSSGIFLLCSDALAS
jgi:hypothetical protein